MNYQTRSYCTQETDEVSKSRLRSLAKSSLSSGLKYQIVCEQKHLHNVVSCVKQIVDKCQGLSRLNGGEVNSFELFQRLSLQCHKLLQTQDYQQFKSRFDCDQDGLLSPNQRLELVQFIIRKCQLVRDRLSAAQMYQLQLSLKASIDATRGYLKQWQNKLRVQLFSLHSQKVSQVTNKKLYNKQLALKSQMQSHQQEKQRRLNELQNQKSNQLYKLEQKSSSLLLKIKPSQQLNQLRLKERVASIDGRIQQALCQRNYLRSLREQEEKKLLDSQKQLFQEKQRAVERRFQSKAKWLLSMLQDKKTILLHRFSKQFQKGESAGRIHYNSLARQFRNNQQKAMMKMKRDDQSRRRVKARSQKILTMRDERKGRYFVEQQRAAVQSQLVENKLGKSELRVEVEDRPISDYAVNEVAKPRELPLLSRLTCKQGAQSIQLCSKYDENLNLIK